MENISENININENMASRYKKYVSCIKVDGIPILPPIVSNKNILNIQFIER